MKLKATGQTLGATIEGLDLSKPLSPGVLGEVMNALGRYGVILGVLSNRVVHES